jgi:hypothetical protein
MLEMDFIAWCRMCKGRLILKKTEMTMSIWKMRRMRKIMMRLGMRKKMWMKRKKKKGMDIKTMIKDQMIQRVS